MVSKLYRGSTIINAARNNPMGSPFEYRKEPTNKKVLDDILKNYFGSKKFYFHRKWYMSSKRKGDRDDDGHKLFSGHEIIQGKMNRPNEFLFRTKKVQMTYQMAFDGLLNEIVAKQQFYHRGKGYWCLYDKTKDINKVKNFKNVPYTDPVTGEKSVKNRDKFGHFRKGYIGYVTWDSDTKNGAFAGDKVHMGDSRTLKPKPEEGRPKAGRR